MSVRASIQQSSVQQCFDVSNCFDNLLCWERGRVPGLLLGLEAIPKPDYMYTQVSRMVWSSSTTTLPQPGVDRRTQFVRSGST
ncbi:hypothetical protein PISMIDRAFT_674533, partial [Pisolithus microcarpus 441]